MNGLPRRTALAVLATSVAGTTLAAATPAQAAPAADRTITFTTRRASITLPGLPSLGLPFSIDLELRDPAGKVIGDGSVAAMVVALVLGPPLKIVTHDKAVLRFADGEIHCSSMHDRTVPNAGVKHPMAIVGGTGAYRGATGDGTLEYTTDTITTITLTLPASA
jgi:hypothetical protein